MSVSRSDSKVSSPSQPRPAEDVQAKKPAAQAKAAKEAKPQDQAMSIPVADAYAPADRPQEAVSRPAVGPPQPKSDRSRLRNKALGASAGPKAEAKPSKSSGGLAALDDAKLAGATAPAAGGGTGSVPQSPADLKKISAEFAHKSDEDLKKIHDNLVAVRDGSPGEKLRAMANLGATFPETLKGVLGSVGLKGGVVDKILDKPDLLKNAATLFDPAKGALDRTGAALAMANDLVGVVGKDKLPQFLQGLTPALPIAKELTGLVQTFQDPEKNALDKAGAVVGFLKAAKEAFPDKDFPKLAGKLEKLGAPLAIAENAITLLDPNKSVAEKAEAAVKIWADIPEAAKAGKELKDWIGKLGIPKGAEIAQAAAAKLPVPAGLSDDLKKAIPDNVASKLSAADVEKLNKLAGDADLKEGLTKLLKNVDDPKQVQNLLQGLEGAKPAAQKALIESLGGMEKKAARKLMTETVEGKPALEVMQKVLSNVPEGMMGDAAKLFGKLDSDAAKVLLKLGHHADGKLVGELLGQAGKVADSVDGKVLTQGLKTLEKLAVGLEKNGIKMGKEAAEKMLKGLGKMIPALGAIPAFADAYGMGKIAFETNKPEIRFLAGMGAALNTVDGALGIAEAFGVGNVAMPASIAMGVAEIGLDLYVNHLRDQEKAGKFEATPELRAAIGATALATAPTGLSMLVGSFGVPGAIEVMTDTVKVGGKLGTEAAKELAKLQGATVEKQLEMTADAINTMADVIRNPEKYGKAAEQMARQAADGIKSTIDRGGKAAEQALKTMGEVADDLKKKGEAGLKQLEWIANNPGKAAEVAQKAIGDMAETALKSADKAAQELGKKALQALDTMGKTYDSAKKQVEKTVGEIAKQGEAALDTLKWAAQNPGVVADAAKKELGDLVLKGGAAAEKAYKTLVDLGDQGKKAIEDLGKKALEAGEKGIQTLEWIAKNPGKAGEAAAQAAVDGLKAAAEGTQKAAAAARDALVKLAEDTGAAGKKAVTALADIVKNGGDAATEVLKAWEGNLTRGGKKVIDALGNLGSAGAEALGKIADKGGEMATEAFKSLWNTSGWSSVQKFIETAGSSAVNNFIGWVSENQGAAKVIEMAKNVTGEGVKAVGGWMLNNLSAIAGAGTKAVGDAAEFLWDNAKALGKSTTEMLNELRKAGGAFLSWAVDKVNPFS